MIRGLYTATSAMLCDTIRQDMVANNLANVDTAGFKHDQAIFKELPSMILHRVNDGRHNAPHPNPGYPKVGKLGTGVIVDETFTDFQIGKFHHTGNTLDTALENEKAFYLFETPRGIRFSRDGVLAINQDGFLTNMNGDFILAEEEPLDETGEEELLDKKGETRAGMSRVRVNPSDTIRIDTDGRIVVNGEARARLSRGKAEDRQAFRKEGNNYFVRAYGAVQRADGRVKPEYIEKPNFSIVTEMVKMIEVSRAYEANAKVIQSHDSLLDKAVNSVGASRR